MTEKNSVKRKIAINLLLIVAVTGCAVVFINDLFLFLPIMLLVSYIFILSAILLVAARLALRFFPSNATPGYSVSERKIRLIALACAIFLFFGSWTINRCFLPHKFHPISLIGSAGILLFTAFLGRSLLDIRRKKKILFIGITIFTLFIASLTYITSKTYQYLEPSTFEALKSLPYLTWVPIKEDKSAEGGPITEYKPDLSYGGLNIYASDGWTEAYLMDMSGNIVHNWTSGTHRWHYVEMYDNGDLLGMVEDESLLKLDWDSNVKWIKKMRFHHDVALAENKDIYIITRNDELVFYRGLPLPILNDRILALSPEGEIKKNISIFKMLKDKIPPRSFGKIYAWIIMPHNLLEMLITKKNKAFAFQGWFHCPSDIFHTNTVEIIDKDIKGVCGKGDLLICVRNLDTIGILNVEKEELIWQWGPGELRMPHHPTMLKNGNILIFDNGWERKFSRIVELNPVTRKIVWEYKADQPEEFFSLKRGANQRLPNGNTLITESDKGHVFEITRDGKIVWEFYSPEIERGQRKAIYRMMRIINTKRLPLK